MSIDDKTKHARFDERNSIFYLKRSARAARDGTEKSVQQTTWEHAKTKAAQEVYRDIVNSWSREVVTPIQKGLEALTPRELSQRVQEFAKQLGADLVGIAKLDAKWVYSHDGNGVKVEIPPEYRYAIVFAVVMDLAKLDSSPQEAANAETHLGYARMAFSASLISKFVRNLGFGAIPCGNDTALSIPLAVDAGLGKLARNGLLLTEEYGSAVRIGKVLTDLPLEEEATRCDHDYIHDHCRVCRLCARACPAEAISLDERPSLTTTGPWNNQGVKSWAVDARKCYNFWEENGTSCSTCIVVCPYSHREAGLTQSDRCPPGDAC